MTRTRRSLLAGAATAAAVGGAGCLGGDDGGEFRTSVSGLQDCEVFAAALGYGS
jgi:hypothetical protein